MEISSSVGLVHVAWVVLALVGLLLQIVVAVDVLTDMSYLRSSGLNGERNIIASMHVRAELIGLAVQLSIAFIALRMLVVDIAPYNLATARNAELLCAVISLLLLARLVFDCAGRRELRKRASRRPPERHDD